MDVKLIWATAQGDQLIASIARVSNPENQHNPSSRKLIQYLIRNNHWSPFEMVSACLEINAPRDIVRQILRHRSFSFQEFSQRYAEPTVLPQAARRPARMQDPFNRQASTPCTEEDIEEWWEKAQERVRMLSADTYRHARDLGIAKEVARAVLSEGLTSSRIYMSGTLRSWMHFCALRSGNGTQLETQVIARQCQWLLRGAFPETLNAWSNDKEASNDR
jgi:thymidylate synthase (FAD)